MIKPKVVIFNFFEKDFLENSEKQIIFRLEIRFLVEF